MKKVVFALAILLAAMPALAAAETTWKDVVLVDGHCAAKIKADPDSHTRSCALECAKAGYGILTADGKYLKFDAEGSAKAKQALEASTKPDHLRVTVVGEMENNGRVKVDSLKFD